MIKNWLKKTLKNFLLPEGGGLGVQEHGNPHQGKVGDETFLLSDHRSQLFGETSIFSAILCL